MINLNEFQLEAGQGTSLIFPTRLWKSLLERYRGDMAESQAPVFKMTHTGNRLRDCIRTEVIKAGPNEPL